MSSALDAVLSAVSPEHGRALEWFVEHEGTVGPRPWRVDGKSVVPGVTMAMTAERGIHKPAGLDWALSIGATSGSLYLDGEPTPVDKYTWVLAYREHSGTQGRGLESRWNRALLRNLRDRIPVGVFVPADGGANLNMGLAMPEDFDPGTGTFLLRGPMRHTQPAEIWEDSRNRSDPLESLLVAEALDAKTLVAVQQRRAQDVFRDSLMDAYAGRCCISRYEVPEALQAAHILAYSGRSSQIPENGLLLRADLHLLFDRHMFGIDPSTMVVKVSSKLTRTPYAGIDGVAVLSAADSARAPDPKRLAVHWAVFSGQ